MQQRFDYGNQASALDTEIIWLYSEFRFKAVLMLKYRILHFLQKLQEFFSPKDELNFDI